MSDSENLANILFICDVQVTACKIQSDEISTISR